MTDTQKTTTAEQPDNTAPAAVEDTDVNSVETTEATESTETTDTLDEDVPKEPAKEDYSAITDEGKAADILNQNGFDYQELKKEYNNLGDISKETREKLSAIGIDNDIVDNYINGQKALVEAQAESVRNEWAESVGGKEQFQQILNWAGSNLTPEEIESYNAVTDTNVVKLILKSLKARMEEKEGITPEYTKGNGGTSAAKDIFRSQAQMFEAIKDPRYTTDEAYRADVQKKIAASREAGIDLGI